VYKSELSYFINGTHAKFAAHGFTSLHSPITDDTDASSAGVRVGQTAAGKEVYFTHFTYMSLRPAF